MFKSSFDHSKQYRYVRYGRMSSEKQNPRSPDQQFDEIDRRIKLCGHRWIHVRDYRDDGKSGRFVSNRPDFCKMLEQIKTGEFEVDLILVDTLERFGRMEGLDVLRRELHLKYGTIVLTADSNFADPTSPAGKALSRYESDRAQNDAEVKGHNVRRGQRDAVKLNHWRGGPPPFGYMLQSVMKGGTGPQEVDYRILVPNPQTAPIVRRIFELADEEGLGVVRSARRIREDESLDPQFRNIRASLVGKILDNEIYVGVCKYGVVSRPAVGDTTVAQRNDESEILIKDDYCEPLISREVRNRVRERRQARGMKMKAFRAAKRKPNGKQLLPIMPGLVLKYPLSGLVRCSMCGASMAPSTSSSGSVSGREYNYLYYRCPERYDGCCQNRIYVPGHWLFQVVVAAIRERLFPLHREGHEHEPDWLEELVSEVRADIQAQASYKRDDRPLLEAEQKGLLDQVAGWRVSLSKSDLSVQVRELLEVDCQQALTRVTVIKDQLQAFQRQNETAEELVNVQEVLERVHRLHEVLKTGNPTDINVELSKHIDQIEAHPSGKVVLRTNRLGLFEGVAMMLGRTANAPDDVDIVNPFSSVPPALYVRRTSTMVLLDSDDRVGANSTRQQVALPEKWVNEEILQIPASKNWPRSHALEVARKRAETRDVWTLEDIARHFGVGPTQIKRALKIAREQTGAATRSPPAT
jgi:DNA invertase Pin-like site-specific DNA recombinase